LSSALLSTWSFVGSIVRVTDIRTSTNSGEREHCHCDEDDAQGGEHRHAHGRWAIVRSALVHTLQVTVFIFLITLVCAVL